MKTRYMLDWGVITNTFDKFKIAYTILGSDRIEIEGIVMNVDEAMKYWSDFLDKHEQDVFDLE